MLGMSPLVAGQAEGANTPNNVKQLSLGWMIGFLFAVSFLGLFSIVPLRKVRKYTLNKSQFWFSLIKFLITINFDIIIASLTSHLFSTPLTFQNECPTDDDLKVQVNIPKWDCNCISHQQLSYTQRSQACKVSIYINVLLFLFFLFLHAIFRLKGDRKFITFAILIKAMINC